MFGRESLQLFFRVMPKSICRLLW